MSILKICILNHMQICIRINKEYWLNFATENNEFVFKNIYRPVKYGYETDFWIRGLISINLKGLYDTNIIQLWDSRSK